MAGRALLERHCALEVIVDSQIRANSSRRRMEISPTFTIISMDADMSYAEPRRRQNNHLILPLSLMQMLLAPSFFGSPGVVNRRA